ncbi:MAG: Crp/Fnr family transcriptional regulator [Ichthyobacteriaceae bacterium]|nr:Crp/Fnr family transcriptional regulator [Ichthyobacteriaceae bacterium]
MNNQIVSCSVCQEKSCASKVLSADHLNDLSNSCRTMTIAKGETILHEGSFTSHVVYLRKGLIKETIRGVDGKEQIFRLIKSQTYLGMSSLFGDTVNHFSYKALSDLDVCHIEIGAFNKLMLGDAKFTYEIMSSLCKENLHNYDKLLKQGHKKIFGRLADALLLFSEEIFESNKFVLPLTQQEIASFIGTSRESTARGLSNFKQNNIISIENSVVEILDKDGLRHISKTG